MAMNRDAPINRGNRNSAPPGRPTRPSRTPLGSTFRVCRSTRWGRPRCPAHSLLGGRESLAACGGSRLTQQVATARIFLLRCAELNCRKDCERREQRRQARHRADARSHLRPRADRRVLESTSDGEVCRQRAHAKCFESVFNARSIFSDRRSILPRTFVIPSEVSSTIALNSRLPWRSSRSLTKHCTGVFCGHAERGKQRVAELQAA